MGVASGYHLGLELFERCDLNRDYDRDISGRVDCPPHLLLDLTGTRLVFFGCKEAEANHDFHRLPLICDFKDQIHLFPNNNVENQETHTMVLRTVLPTHGHAHWGTLKWGGG